jgi:Seryl-tRNA synthetase
MHNLKDIRKDFENFKNKLKVRNIDIDIENLKTLDEKNRKLIQKKESLENEKKEISKSKDESLFKRSKDISKELDSVTDNQKSIKIDLEKILSNIPNIPHKDVPNGVNENDNIEISKSGTVPSFDFKPKSHYELGENLKMLDFDLAAKTTGSRFVFVKDKLALLERALSNYMLDKHILHNGYHEISPPLIASENTMYGTGQLPKLKMTN